MWMVFDFWIWIYETIGSSQFRVGEALLTSNHLRIQLISIGASSLWFVPALQQIKKKAFGPMFTQLNAQYAYIYISVANRSNWRQQCDALALQLFITSSSSHLPIILLLPPSNSRLKCLLTLSLHALYLNLGQTNALAIRKMKSKIKKNAIRTGNVRSGRSLLLSTTCNRAVSVVCALILF